MVRRRDQRVSGPQVPFMHRELQAERSLGGSGHLSAQATESVANLVYGNIHRPCKVLIAVPIQSETVTQADKDAHAHKFRKHLEDCDPNALEES